jgi:hypothetical protein
MPFYIVLFSFLMSVGNLKSQDCNLYINNFELSECIDNEYDISFTVLSENTTSEYFDVIINGLLIDNYEFAQDTILIENLPWVNEITMVLQICENDNPGCCYTVNYTPPCACKIDNTHSEIVECSNEFEQYYFWLDFDYQMTSDSFLVGTNTTNLGKFAYTALPVLVGPLSFSSISNVELLILDSENPFCFTPHQIGVVDNCELPCNMDNMEVYLSPCNANNDKYLTFSFQYENTSIEGFEVVGNGNSYGTFSYGSDSYILGPLAADCDSINEFIIKDITHADCQIEYVFDNPLCCGEAPSCNISEIIVDPQECDGEGTYSLVLNFEYQGTSNQFFNVYAKNDVLIGTYLFSDLPVTIANFPERDADFDFIKICENDNPDCCQAYEFEGLNCNEGGDECSITEVFAEAYACNDTSNLVFIDISFIASGDTSSQFTIVGNGVNYGNFSYGEDFYTIGPVAANCETIYEFIVVDSSNDNCRGEFVFEEALCCEDTSACNISEIVVDPQECDGEGTYSLVLNFEYQGTSNQSFNVFAANDVLIGTYLFSDLPVTIANYPERDADFDFIKICENDNPDCCQAHEFEGLNCNEGGDECSITEVFAEAYACNDTSNLVFIDISFIASGDTSSQFTIVGNGVNYGNFSYGEDFYTVGPVAANCETIYEFIVVDSSNDNCRGEFVFEEALCCEETPSCNISEIVVDPQECDGEGTYSLVLNFEYQGTTNQFFNVFAANDVLIGTYLFSDLPVTIANFPERDADFDFIKICENDNPDCCQAYEFEGLNCNEGGDECSITEVFAEAYACNDTSNLVFIDISFIASGDTSSQFTIVGNGVNYGNFSYGEDFYTVGPVAANCETLYEFIVVDSSNDNCR